MTRPLTLAALLVMVVVGCATASPPPRAQIPSAAASRAADVALSMVGRPYQYGGNTPEGFDCSGLVRYSYGVAGVALPRDTRALRGETVLVAWHDLATGDILFFDQEGKKLSHVGIYLGEGRFVHAPSSGGKVRTDSLDAAYWQKHFVEARRI
jgi:cell wall-associated NlpC family hydrolase